MSNRTNHPPATKKLRKKSKRRYSEDEKKVFVEMAGRIGVQQAMKHLGYPSNGIAYDWCDAYGVEIPRSALMVAAKQIDRWYGITEQRVVAEGVLDAAYERLSQGEVATVAEDGSVTYRPLLVREVASMAMAVQRAVQTLNLIEGKATEIIEANTDATTPELLELIEKKRQENVERVRHLRAVE